MDVRPGESEERILRGAGKSLTPMWLLRIREPSLRSSPVGWRVTERDCPKKGVDDSFSSVWWLPRVGGSHRHPRPQVSQGFKGLGTRISGVRGLTRECWVSTSPSCGGSVVASTSPADAGVPLPPQSESFTQQVLHSQATMTQWSSTAPRPWSLRTTTTSTTVYSEYKDSLSLSYFFYLSWGRVTSPSSIVARLSLIREARPWKWRD